MNGPRHCPACGAVLRKTRLGGVCPACLWKGLLDSGEGQTAVDGSTGLPSTELTTSKGESLMEVRGYEILGEIARGGMGIVYRARQLDPPRTVALKMLLPYQRGSPEMAERFRLEVRALTALEHPAILPVYQVGERDRLPFFTMKLATGGTLAERKGQLAGNWRAIAELIATLADAVHFAHERGVLHRDLKPANVLFDESSRAYVSDFGLAKLIDADEGLTRSASFLGTPHYVAPEVAARSPQSATIASDIYSLGAILYELLAGQPPFDAEGVPALLKKIAEEEPAPPSAIAREGSIGGAVGTPRPSIPRDLEVICLKCLAKEPTRRYRWAHELAEDLRRWLGGHTILARSATTIERLRGWARRNPARAGLSAALLVVLGAALFLQAQANRRLHQLLTRSLLAQAELQRSSGRAGQRFQTLDLIRRATENRFGGKVAQESRVALRTEVAAALALPDLRPLVRWPAHISHFENEFDFTPDLARYAMGTVGGGLAVFATADHKGLWQMSGITNNPPVEFRISSDGRWIAATFQDGHAELHSLAGNQMSRRWQGGRSGRSHFAFAPRADRLAVAAATEGGVEIMQVIGLESGAVETEFSHRGTRTMAFDPTGQRLALGGADLAIRNLATGNDLWSIRLPRHASAVAWSPDGRSLAVALDYRIGDSDEAFKGYPVLLFDPLNGSRKKQLAEVTTRIESLAFHPDGGSLAVATWQSDLLWVSVHPDRSPLIATGAQRALRFSADGKRLAYAPSKEELGVLEVATPTVLREWELDSAPAKGSFTLAVSANGRWVAAGTDAGIQLWDARMRKQVGVMPVPPQTWWVSVLFAPGDRAVYYSGSQFGVWRAALVETNEPDGTISLRFGRTELLSESKGFTATRFAADGRSLVVGENRRRSHNDRTPPTIWLWEDGDRTRARKLVENFPLIGYRVLPGGRWAVSTDLIEPDLWVWNPETGERERSLGIALPVNSEPAPNGRWLVTRTRTEFVVWEVGSWRALARWPTPENEQTGSSMAISLDSRLLATTSTDGRITVRSMPFGTELITLIPPRPMRLGDWKFTADSGRLYVLPLTGHMFEWNLAELRQELAQLKLDW